MPHPENLIENLVGGTDGRGLFESFARCRAGALAAHPRSERSKDEGVSALPCPRPSRRLRPLRMRPPDSTRARSESLMIRNDVAITPELVKEHGLTPDEYERFVDLIGRDADASPSSASSRPCGTSIARTNPRACICAACRRKRPWVIQGPGENAGVIDIGDGLACIFKMESHNHPSFIEPYQGATTGVGGILRDVFTMGARPIACLNFLRFGEPDHPEDRRIWSRAWSRASAATAIPSACRPSAAASGFHPRYNGNILVNAMAVGLARTDEIFYAAGDRRRKSDRLSRLEDRPRRHPRRHHGVGRIRRRVRGEAPDRAGRRSLRREAAAGSLPRAHEIGRRHRDPGHGRGRPHQLRRRDGRQGQSRRRARPRQGALPRGGHDRLRDDAVGKPGAHAHGAETRHGEAGRGDLPQMGPRLRDHRQDHRYASLRGQAPGRGEGRSADQGTGRRGSALRPSRMCATPQTAGDRARQREGPDLRRRGAPEARRLAGPVLASAGSGSNTTT